jgi:hypothetical protein
VNQRQAMRITAQVMSDEQPLAVTISIKDAWLMISGLQLAARHPDLGTPLKQHLEQIGRQFQDAITERHPLAEQLLEMGWNTDFDVSSRRHGNER